MDDRLNKKNMIEKLKELEKAAAPGPWTLPEDKTVQESNSDWLYTPYVWTPTGGILSNYKFHTGAPKEDWELLLAARNALPALLAIADTAKKLEISFYRDPETGCPYDQTSENFINALDALEPN